MLMGMSMLQEQHAQGEKAARVAEYQHMARFPCSAISVFLCTRSFAFMELHISDEISC